MTKKLNPVQAAEVLALSMQLSRLAGDLNETLAGFGATELADLTADLSEYADGLYQHIGEETDEELLGYLRDQVAKGDPVPAPIAKRVLDMFLPPDEEPSPEDAGEEEAGPGAGVPGTVGTLMLIRVPEDTVVFFLPEKIIGHRATIEIEPDGSSSVEVHE